MEKQQEKKLVNMWVSLNGHGIILYNNNNNMGEVNKNMVLKLGKIIICKNREFNWF